MKVREYRAVAYKQATDPSSSWILSLVVPAEELLEWAGIPRRSSDAEMAGFQRAYTESRVEKAKSFFEIPVNQSPTALVVGLHATNSDAGSSVELKFDEGTEQESIRPCTVTVRYPEETDHAAIIASIRAQIALRIGDSASAEDDDDPDGIEENGESDTDDTDDEDEEIELGRSLLMRLSDRLQDDVWCKANQDALLDLAKPATVIDGQHRLKGAERCERMIPFAVCALYDCDWSEQVFQFTVVNYTQKGIPDQFITNNAALSLTQDELGALQERLVQAGVKVVEYDLMKIVHFHDDSPFKDLVNLSEKRDPTKIGYKTMVRLARAWYDGKHELFKMFLPQLYPDIAGKRSHKQRVSRWRQNDWGLFFLDFWSTVHSTYVGESSHVEGATLWTVGQSNLLIAIVLYELQSAFFNNLNQQDEEFFDPKSKDADDILAELRGKFKKRANKFVEWFPADFFGRQWKQKSLSTGPGRKALQDTFTSLVKSKGKYQYGSSNLITG